MTERYLRERVYRVKQKLGGLEVHLRWPLPKGKDGPPAFLSFRLAGTAGGKVKAAQIDLEGSCISEFLALRNFLKGGEVSTGKPVLRLSGFSGTGQLRWLEVLFLGEGLRKPWELQLYRAEGEGDLILSEPIRVRVSEQTLGNLIEKVCCRAKN